MTESLNRLTEDQIAGRLAAALQTAVGQVLADSPYLAELHRGDPRPAAVLVPLLRQAGAWSVLYTRRTASLPEHSGQVAFPGGRADPGEADPESTALREAREEIGLEPGRVRLLGRLPTYLTITNYSVTPVVGVIPWPFPLRISAEEVARVFTIPLSWLADPANHEARLRKLPEPYAPVPVIYFQPYDGEVLWGASARFTLSLLRALEL